ncbi:MAG: LamB/YcsF family protein [Myxococcota bacterium]
MGAFLNIDAGELPDEPDELYALAGMLNVACGGHAGDPRSIQHVLERAAPDTRISAHLSYPDRKNFGRATVKLPPDELASSLRQQLALLDAATHTLQHIKLHGALYHDAARDPSLASLVVQVAREKARRWTFIGPKAGALREAVEREGWGYLVEGFADRRYAPDGNLVPRSQPDALILDPQLAAQQAVQLVQEQHVDTVCVHSDTPRAVEIARAVSKVLKQH